MGNCQCYEISAQVAEGSEGVAVKIFPREYDPDKRLAEAVQELSANRIDKPQTFMSLLLKFPELHKGFDKCREVFKACDSDYDNHITLKEMQQGLHACGFSTPADKDIIQGVFNSSDLDNNHTIEFREFIVALAVLYVLKKCKGLPMSGLDAKVMQTFQTVLDCFLFFDKQRGGVLNKGDVLQGMKDQDKHENSVLRTGSDVNLQVDDDPVPDSMTKRFHEMDWNHDGTIAFKEFMFALESWVLEDE